MPISKRECRALGIDPFTLSRCQVQTVGPKRSRCRVALSRIKGAGHGLFAGARIGGGEVVAEYVGDPVWVGGVFGSGTGAVPLSHLARCPGTDDAIDGSAVAEAIVEGRLEGDASNAGCMANSVAGTKEAANAALEWVRGAPGWRCFVVALHPLCEGEEVLLRYRLWDVDGE